jgi:uncharacterized membrane protein
MSMPGGLPPPTIRDPLDADRLRSLRTFTHVLYALYAVYWLTGGVSVLVAIILNYLKRDEALGTPYEQHFTWQIRTFWLGLAGHLIGVALFIVLIGIPVLWAVAIWTLYRIIKGWLYLYDNKPLADPRSWV